MKTVTIVIPAYNRAELLGLVLDKLAQSDGIIAHKVLVIDDGSDTPLSELVSVPSPLQLEFLRQENKGLVYAKYKGLMATQTPYVLFLDSDDFIHPQKISEQLGAMEKEDADVSYSASATVTISEDLKISEPFNAHQPQSVSSSEQLYLKLQPLPHSPIYRTRYIQETLTHPIVPLHQIFNPIGEVWFYYNLCTRPANIVSVPKVLTFVSRYEGVRITNNWEKLGVASLALMKSFMAKTQNKPEAGYARTLISKAAFSAWRKLPRNFNSDLEKEFLSVWKAAHTSESKGLGGAGFQTLAHIIGPVLAAKVLKTYQRPGYKKLATMSEQSLEALLILYKEYISSAQV